MERGPSQSRGFTLIELMMVIVIIGVLATVLIPRWASARDQAYVAAMTSQLRNLAMAEESYYGDYDVYAPTVGLLPAYSPTTGTNITIVEATQGGWSASATSAYSQKQCFRFVGRAAPVGAATQEGQVACQ